MVWSWFVDLFSHLYNFLMSIVEILNKPFNTIFFGFEFYNPFNDSVFSFGNVDMSGSIFEFINGIHDSSLAVFQGILGDTAVTVSDPTWLVLLYTIPVIFGASVLIKIVVGVFFS